MGRYKKFMPGRIATSALASGGTMSFYEPDALLSQQMSPKKALTTDIAIRETAWNYYRVLGFLPNPSETLRKLSKDIAEYKYLLEDAHISGVFGSRKAGTLCQGWELNQNNANDKQYKTIKALFDAWPVYDIMSEALNCIFFGYQPVEVLWERVNGMILPKEAAPKDPDWFRFSDLNELRYLTKRNMVTGEPVPNYKFLLPRFRPSYERPYGRPLGSTVYWYAKMIHAGFRFFTQFVEKFGQPWVMAKYPLGTQKARVQELLNMLDTTVQDGVTAYPSEWEVEALDVNKTSSSVIFKDFIELCKEQISIAMLGQNLTTQVSGGSFAASKTHGEIRTDIVAEDTRIMENMFDTLISWIYELNFGESDNKPEFKLTQKPAPSVEDGQLAVSLFQTGITFTKEYYQNRFNLLDSEFDLNAAADSSSQLTNGTGGAAITTLTHDARDPATNTATYNSTKGAIQNLTRR
jgi:phage gp29-like protein